MTPTLALAALDRFDIKLLMRDIEPRDDDRWAVIDTKTADPDTNWPGEMVSEHATHAEARLGMMQAVLAELGGQRPTKANWIDRAAWCAERILPLIEAHTPNPCALVALPGDDGLSAVHLHSMARRLIARELDSETKACRWLGWLQAGVVALGIATLESMKELNLASGGLTPRMRDTGFQERSQVWLDEVTKDDPTDLLERIARFYEEATEWVQALGFTAAQAAAIQAYVFSRKAGDVPQEIGGMLNTAAVLARFTGHDMMACGEAELLRVWDPRVIERIRQKRATRHGRGVLPGVVEQDPVSEHGWLPIEGAKHDCTLYELMVPSHGSGLRDAETSLTIGSNNGDHDGEDSWTYVGWNWEQDCFVHRDTRDGDPAPTHYREMRPDPQGQPASEPDPADHTDAPKPEPEPSLGEWTGGVTPTPA